MKRISPAQTYTDDAGYPAADTPTGAPGAPSSDRARGATRRGFLGALAAGAAALGSGLLATNDARAAPKIRLPGGPPAPTPPPPTPRPSPPPAPAAPSSCVNSVTLRPRFRFCGGVTGQVVVETTDCRFAATLKLPSEARQQRRLIGALLAKHRSCGWLSSPAKTTHQEAVIAAALVAYYQKQLCRPLAAARVQLVVIPPPAPRPVRDPRPRLGGVPPVPRRGCASCSTADAPGDWLLPTGLALLGLWATRRNSD